MGWGFGVRELGIGMLGFRFRGGVSVGDECGKQGALFRVVYVDISYILCYVLPFYTTYRLHSYEQERDSYRTPQFEVRTVCDRAGCEAESGDSST